MALRDEIIFYTDPEGFVAPNLVQSGALRGSDNGPLFSSEYYVMLSKLGQLANDDKDKFVALIEGNLFDGLLNRHKVVLGDNGQEGPDDYYGVLNGSKTLGITSIPRKFLKAVVRYSGFLNNDRPGVKTWRSFLVRQPQLLAAMIAAGFPSFRNPLHLLIRMLATPLFLIAAVSIAFSCIGVDPGSADPRRLAWHLQSTTKSVSLLCWLASLLWLRRLYKTYPDGMKGAAKVYYEPGHPFIKYWVT